MRHPGWGRPRPPARGEGTVGQGSGVPLAVPEAAASCTTGPSSTTTFRSHDRRRRTPRAAGRRGGIASGVTRRLRKQRELEEKIASTKNGAAIFGLYRTQLERDRALERERLRLDRMVCELMDEADAERATIARLRERRRQYEAAVTQRFEALEAREAELRERLETDAGLDAWLLELGEERIRASASRLGWIEDEDDDAVA